MRFGVVVFPGSNCDHDAWYATSRNLGHDSEFIWHDSSSLGNSDAVILPGGFSYGDYLRSGAIARFSPIMKEVVKFAHAGGPVLGICNGFQILVEAGLLPGALMRNNHLRFSCKFVYIRVEKNDSIFTSAASTGDVLKIPIAHKDGNYYNFQGDIDSLIKNQQVLFRYCGPDGKMTSESNPNGSAYNIAGITNEQGNVAGMMPHPERAVEDILGSSDGLKIFNSIKHSLTRGKKLERA